MRTHILVGRVFDIDITQGSSGANNDESFPSSPTPHTDARKQNNHQNYHHEDQSRR